MKFGKITAAAIVGSAYSVELGASQRDPTHYNYWWDHVNNLIPMLDYPSSIIAAA